MSQGELIFIGLGLHDEKDITINGLNTIKKCEKIFAEFYTSKLTGTNKNKMEELFGKKITILKRQETEKADSILESARKQKTAFLVCGDPMMATTHIDLRLRAKEKNIKTTIIHGNSIITAVPGLLGLQNYKFGRTTTLALPEKDYFPTSPYEIIKENKKMELHTLILLDIKADKKIYLTANKSIELLLKMEDKIKNKIITKNTLVCVVAQAGSSKPIVKADTAEKLLKKDFGPPLHTIVIPGKMHFMEIEALVKFAELPEELAKKIQKL